MRLARASAVKGTAISLSRGLYQPLTFDYDKQLA